MAGRSRARIKGGGGGGLANLLLSYFGGNVGVDPGFVPGESTEPFKAGNWLSKPTASQLNQQFNLNRFLSQGGVQDALAQAEGMLPIEAKKSQTEADIALAKQKDLEKFLTTEQGSRWFLSFLAQSGLDPSNPDTVAKYNTATADPIITQKAAEAAAKGEEATLAGQVAARAREMDIANDPELRNISRNQALAGSEASRFELQNLVKTLNARQQGLEQAPDIARLNAIKNQFYPVPSGTQILDTATGAVKVPATFKPDAADKYLNFLQNGGAALKPPMAPVPTQQQMPGGQLILKDGVLYDIRTGQPVHRVSPFQ